MYAVIAPLCHIHVFSRSISQSHRIGVFWLRLSQSHHTWARRLVSLNNHQPISKVWKPEAVGDIWPSSIFSSQVRLALYIAHVNTHTNFGIDTAEYEGSTYPRRDEYYYFMVWLRLQSMIASQCDFEMLSKGQRTRNMRVLWTGSWEGGREASMINAVLYYESRVRCQYPFFVLIYSTYITEIAHR
jgi:hypothetical protein